LCYFLIRSKGSDNEIFIWCTIIQPTPTHQQPTYQQPTHLQNFADDMSLLNELQNAISAVSVVQTLTSKTAKEFEFGSLHKEFNLFETSGVRSPNLDMLLSASSKKLTNLVITNQNLRHNIQKIN
jgi:hypothetical protein